MEVSPMHIALVAFAGGLTGLPGVGGGLIIVPVLAFIFTALQFPDGHILYLAGNKFQSYQKTS